MKVKYTGVSDIVEIDRDSWGKISIDQDSVRFDASNNFTADVGEAAFEYLVANGVQVMKLEDWEAQQEERRRQDEQVQEVAEVMAADDDVDAEGAQIDSEAETEDEGTGGADELEVTRSDEDLGITATPPEDQDPPVKSKAARKRR